MFDIAFSELLVIAVVALLVIGPEKLPKVARTVGAFAGRMQRYVAQVKEEVNREVRFEELQKLQQEIKQSVETNIVKPVERETAALEASIHGPSGDAKKKTQASTEKKLIRTATKSTSKATKNKTSKAKPIKVKSA